MITQKTLNEWERVKNLAVKSFTIEPAIIIAIQEMYIESKGLRRDNLKLLNSEELINKLANFVHLTIRDSVLTSEMEAVVDEIEEISSYMNRDLGLKND